MTAGGGSPGPRSTPAKRASSSYVGIKGPLTTPVGGGIRSLNVALRQLLDLYVCLRPVRWYRGVPSPVKHPEKVDMVIFRENTEDIYAGIEYAAGTPEAQKVLDFLAKEFPKDFKKVRFGSAEASAGWQKALEEIGDASCLENLAAAYDASSRSGDRWWREHVATAFRAIVHREGLTRRHAAVKRSMQRWPEATADLMART